MNVNHVTPVRLAGYSLVEMLVVLVVMGLIAGASYGGLHAHMPTARLEQSARDLFAEIRAARQTAITHGNNVVLIFDTAQRRYRVWEDIGSDGFMSESETERIIDLPSDVSIFSALFGASNRLTFRPNGSAVAGGTVELRGTRLGKGRIDVTRATGKTQLTVTQ